MKATVDRVYIAGTRHTGLQQSPMFVKSYSLWGGKPVSGPELLWPKDADREGSLPLAVFAMT